MAWKKVCFNFYLYEVTLCFRRTNLLFEIEFVCLLVLRLFLFNFFLPTHLIIKNICVVSCHFVLITRQKILYLFFNYKINYLRLSIIRRFVEIFYTTNKVNCGNFFIETNKLISLTFIVFATSIQFNCEEWIRKKFSGIFKILLKWDSFCHPSTKVFRCIHFHFISFFLVC